MRCKDQQGHACPIDSSATPWKNGSLMGSKHISHQHTISHWLNYFEVSAAQQIGNKGICPCHDDVN